MKGYQVTLVMVVSEDESRTLFARLDAEGVRIFYLRTPVEFGVVGEG